MPKRTNEFQQIVRRIYEALAGTTAAVSESVLLSENHCDAVREVDVLVTTTVAMHDIKTAIECRDHARDQDITWVDGLIGKYIDLDDHKVVAVSQTNFSKAAAAKGAQHNIELLTLREAQDLDWASKVGPLAFQIFAFRNSPIRVVLQLNSKDQLKVEYTFEGEQTPDLAPIRPYAEFFLELWHSHMADIAGERLSEHVFTHWNNISRTPNTPRYAELVESYATPRTLSAGPGESISFDTVVWGIGTKYTAEAVVPRKWSMGEKAAVLASAIDDQGKPIRITLVVDRSGHLLGANVESAK